MKTLLVLLAGVVMILSSVAHAGVGWPAMLVALHGAGAPDDLIGALAVGWFFGSMAMAAFGVIVIVRALAGLPVLGKTRRTALIACLALLPALCVSPARAALDAPDADGGGSAGAPLSLRQLKARYGEIFAFDLDTVGGRTVYVPRLKTLPEGDALSGFVSANDMFLSFLQVNGVSCGDLLKKRISGATFQARCLDRMRKSVDIDAALLPAVDRYLRGLGGNGLEGYEAPTPATVTLRRLISVAARFYFPDTIQPDGSVQIHICVGVNGLKDLQGPRNLAVEAFVAGVILDDAKSETHPLRNEFFETLSRIARLDLSSDPEVRLTRIQGALWASLADSRRLRRALRRGYDRSRDWLPFVLVEDDPDATSAAADASKPEG